MSDKTGKLCVRTQAFMDQGNYLHTTDEGLLTRRLLTDMVTSSVVDPDSLNPDLTFQVNPDPDTVHIQSGSNPDPGLL
jgi:hypothetical protein